MTIWLESQLTLLLARCGARSERAQSMVEYSIIAALVAIVALAAVSTLGKDIAGVFQKIAGQVAPLGDGGGG